MARLKPSSIVYRLSSRRGFTLIELIVVIVIIGIVAGIAVPFVVSAIDAWVAGKNERDLMFSARMAMNRIVREIRQIKSVNDITTFNATCFTFTDINNSSVDFQQSGNSLLRNSDELANKLQNPDGLTFTYLDSNSAVTATKADIRMVRIKLALSSGDASVTLQSLARFRNI